VTRLLITTASAFPQASTAVQKSRIERYAHSILDVNHLRIAKHESEIVPAPAIYGVVWHNRTNTENFAVIFLQPKRDFALVLATNVFTPELDQALSTVVAAQLYRRFVPTNA
jgi:hypothetical protein